MVTTLSQTHYRRCTRQTSKFSSAADCRFRTPPPGFTGLMPPMQPSLFFIRVCCQKSLPLSPTLPLIYSPTHPPSHSPTPQLLPPAALSLPFTSPKAMTPPPPSALASAPTATPELDITLTKTQTKVNKSGGCGCSTTSDPTTEMSESLKARIENHPCYSEEAHHHYARMHVAVAPACNIQVQLLQPQIRLRQRKPPRRGERTADPRRSCPQSHGRCGQDSPNDGAGHRWPWRPPGQPRKKPSAPLNWLQSRPPRH